MVRGGVISDELWDVIEPVLPSGVGVRGRPWNDHRLMLEAIAWRFRTGSPWRDLPGEFGAWQTVWKRHRRWSVDGTYERMFAQIRAVGPEESGSEQVLRVLSADSTIVRAHQHAAGARKGGGIK